MKNTLKVLLSFLMAVSVMFPNLSLLARAEEGEELTVEETMPTTSYPTFSKNSNHENEPNDTFVNATLQIDEKDYCQAEIGSYDYYLETGKMDVDIFRFNQYIGNTYEISVSDYQANFKDTSLKIDLLDYDQNVVASISDALKKNGTNIYTYTATDSAVHYIRFYNYLDSKTKTDHYYSVHVETKNEVSYLGRETEFHGAYFIEYNKRVKSAWRFISRSWYYFDGNGLAKTGWFKYGNSWYYFIPDSFNMVNYGPLAIKGKYYMFRDDGRLVTNGWYKDNRGYWYYVNSDDTVQYGWFQYKNDWYYTDINGKMVTGWLQYGNSWYYLNSSGIMQTGWLKYGNSWYYLKSGGEMAIGWVKYGNSWYFMDANGKMMTGWYKDSKGDKYYLKSGGEMATGWQKIDGDWYYFKSSGIMAKGWLKYGNSWYYLYSNGIMATGWLNDGGNFYYLKDSGEMVTGWFDDGYEWYYFKSSGIMATGWLKYGNSWYYMDEYGAMQTGWYTDSKGNTYYLNDDGEMVTGTQVIGGTKYTFNSSGILVS